MHGVVDIYSLMEVNRWVFNQRSSPQVCTQRKRIVNTNCINNIQNEFMKPMISVPVSFGLIQ